MHIKKLILGPLETNCYILEKNAKQLIIDPADEYEKIKKYISNPQAILITHYHFDHIGALDEIKKEYNIPVYDYKSLGNVEVGNFVFSVIPTKGHHETCVCFVFDNIIFVGDLIFKYGVGRTDLETGDAMLMTQSLNKIKAYKGYIAYPGHEDEFTI